MGDWDNAFRSGLSLYGPHAPSVSPLPAVVQFERMADRRRLTAQFQPGCLYRLWRSDDLASWYMPSLQAFRRETSTLALDDLDPVGPKGFYRLSATVIVEP